jgi:hypothetical protein
MVLTIIIAAAAIEFKKKLNPAVDGDALVARLISLVQLQVYVRWTMVFILLAV